MKTAIRYASALVCILMLPMVFGSCDLSEGYCIFRVDTVSEHSVNEYFTSEKMEFAHVGEVVIVPAISAISHDTDSSGNAIYQIAVRAYSQTGNENVTIGQVKLLRNDLVIYTGNDESKAAFKDEDGVFCAWVKIGEFRGAETQIDGGDELEMFVDVLAEKDGVKTEETKSYVIHVEQYLRPKLPT